MYVDGDFPFQAQAVRQSVPAAAPVAHATRQAPLLSVMSDTMIPTPKGPVAAHALAAGDEVLDENGAVVRVTGTTLIPCTRDALLENRALAPVRFDPSEDDVVSVSAPILLAPDHPIYASDVTDISVPAAALENAFTIRRVIPDEGIDYIRLDLARPATLAVAGLRLSVGAAADVEHTGPIALTPWRAEIRAFRPVA